MLLHRLIVVQTNSNVDDEVTEMECGSELCADELVVGGGVGGVRPDERALKQRTRWTGVFFWFYRGQPLHL